MPEAHEQLEHAEHAEHASHTNRKIALLIGMSNKTISTYRAELEEIYEKFLKLWADLDPKQPSVLGADIIRHYFAVGELSPTIAVMRTRARATQRSMRRRFALVHLPVRWS